MPGSKPESTSAQPPGTRRAPGLSPWLGHMSSPCGKKPWCVASSFQVTMPFHLCSHLGFDRIWREGQDRGWHLCLMDREIEELQE